MSQRGRINHQESATRFKLTLADLNVLLEGRATAAVAQRLGVSMGDINAFIEGRADFAMTERLGFVTPGAGNELATVAGKEGAIGVLLGILLLTPPAESISR